MKLGIIPYQKETDFVYNDNNSTAKPNWPVFDKMHTYEIDGEAVQFVRPEDVPLNKRHFVYRTCAPNTLFTELGYACTEYPFKKAGFNMMDRSNVICLRSNSNDTVSVGEGEGWRTSRADVCIKEGVCYWEVEVCKGGLDEALLGGAEDTVSPDLSDANKKQHKRHKRDLINMTSHLRFGVSRREASLESPIGTDCYGYGVRDISFESIHEGKIMQVLAQTKELKAGDRIGFLLKLPPVETQIKQAQEYTARKIEKLIKESNGHTNEKNMENESGSTQRKKAKAAPTFNDFEKALLEDIDHSNVIRDKIPIRYKNQLFFESTDYVKTIKPEYYASNETDEHASEEYALENSSLGVYLNGKPLGDAFKDLKPFLPPFSELQYNEKFYFGYWKNGEVVNENDTRNYDTIENVNKAVNKKKGLILRNKYVNNNSLGYYPTVSCFNGGTAKIVTHKEDLKYYDTLKETDVNTLDTLFMEQVAEDIVWDIIDEVEETASR
ncbi:hypothetical protein TPHA_0N00900 [Tetrapisispora phaffii CBS 4417]|uniref:SPRY domain-containing protein n=1 Tax=Tetrapisispora phaffii (strain ATCC 24235 / CBS 4417 / NBRC 1672 / NRRL Y-8282 / UCD 70-5) TaxID=1071381 RepID=G8C143_TETPH|nr:hypothetical protein TPHA_0N00900 [Tetrapisispora phaffii CBS 4417]CCE65871.1 hypothetical protein TPHA_0N00900 [Tetrapisispora phaffii CBS 4417]